MLLCGPIPTIWRNQRERPILPSDLSEPFKDRPGRRTPISFSVNLALRGLLLTNAVGRTDTQVSFSYFDVRPLFMYLR
jgi:hypothetical protein